MTQPPRHSHPHDLRLIPKQLETLTYRGQAPFTVNYILTCDKDEPDIGDTFKLIVSAWCKNGASVRKAKQFVLLDEAKPWRESKDKHWVTIWTGGQYQLQDFGKEDSKALATRVLGALEGTHDILLKKIQDLRP
jgi:hypothetical protein